MHSTAASSPKRPSNQKEGDVLAVLAQFLERFKPRPVRKTVVGENRVEIFLLQCPVKLLLILGQCVIQAKSGFPEFMEYQLNVISRVSHDEHMQRRHALQSAEFFECARFH